MPRRPSVWLICSSAVFAAVTSAGAQSLADVARKEEARRKTVAQPAKVYTNKDLHPTPAPASAAAAAKPDDKATPEKPPDKPPADQTTPKDQAAKAAGGAGEPAKEPVKDKAYWAGRLKAAQEQLDRDQTYADALQSRINALTTDFINRDDPAQKALLERDRLKAIAELDRLKAAIPNDKKAIENLLEEARRAGVPPGWLR